MHDTYSETLEAVKKLIPALNAKGYNVVSVSKLMEIKDYNYIEPLEIIKQFKMNYFFNLYFIFYYFYAILSIVLKRPASSVGRATDS